MKCPVVSGSLGTSRDEAQAGTSGKQDDPRGAIALARMNWLHNKYNIVSSISPLCIFQPEVTVHLPEQ